MSEDKNPSDSLKAVKGSSVARTEAQLKQVAEMHQITTARRSLFSDAWFRLIRNKASVVSMVIIVIFILIAVFANVLAPMNPLQLNSGKGLLPPVFIEIGPTGDAPALLSLEDQLAQSNGTVTANLIRLYKALGGGWQPEPPPAAPSSTGKG